MRRTVKRKQKEEPLEFELGWTFPGPQHNVLLFHQALLYYNSIDATYQKEFLGRHKFWSNPSKMMRRTMKGKQQEPVEFELGGADIWGLRCKHWAASLHLLSLFQHLAIDLVMGIE